MSQSIEIILQLVLLDHSSDGFVLSLLFPLFEAERPPHRGARVRSLVGDGPGARGHDARRHHRRSRHRRRSRDLVEEGDLYVDRSRSF